MKKFITILFLISFVQLSFGQFTTVWEKSAAAASLPVWFSTASTERGFGYGNVAGNDRLYVASRNGGNYIRIVNANDGLDVGTLDVTAISGGTYLISDVSVSSDGVIFVCNMTVNASTSAFKVYKWTSEVATPTNVISFTGLATRLGDKFTVVGSTTDNSITIYAGSTTGTSHVRFTTTDNAVSFTATTITGPTGAGSASFGPLTTGISDYYYNAGGQNVTKYQSDGTLIGTVPGGVVATGSTAIRYLGSFGGDEFFETNAYGSGNENARIVRVPSNTPASASLYGATTSLGTNSNPNGTGDVDYKVNSDGTITIYVLGTNNGIGAYTTNSYPLNSNVTPRTVPMTEGVSNVDAFSSKGLIGTDGTSSFYAHWDATYLYLGWTGGKTNYTSDLYYAAIDIDPAGTNGTTNAIEGVGFQSGNPNPDFYVVYENNSSYYGAPVTEGNAFEIYNVNAGAWNWVSRTAGDDATSSQVVFSDGPGEVRLRVAWSDLGSFTPGPGNKLGIVMWNNNSDGNYMWARVPSSNPANGSTTITLTHEMQYANTGSSTDPSNDFTIIALPVELSSFTALTKGASVNLNWKTATEVNSYAFEIERTNSDAQQWEKITVVNAHGNSNAPISYSYTDENLNAGKYSYRLKMIDNDGSYAYSAVAEASVEQPNEYVLQQNYPNPFNPVTTIQYSLPVKSDVMLQIYSINGELVTTLVNEKQPQGAYNVNFNASGYASGTYIYRLIAGSFVQTKKMILLK